MKIIKRAKKIKRKRAVAMALALYLLLNCNCVAAVAILTPSSRKRRFGVRPMNRKRDSEGLFATLIQDMINLEWDEDQFFKYTRMTKNQFNYLHEQIKMFLQKNRKKKHISTQQRLIITLHYLSEGCSMQEIAWNYRIGVATAHQIIKETCRILWDVLSPTQLPVPSVEDFLQISKGFYRRWNVPNCIGAVDGKHINIKAPKKSGTEFFNYKKSFSLVLMATCDAYMRFTMVDIGEAGANHDSAVFKRSGFGSCLLNKSLNIPPPRNMPNTNINMPHYIIGDSAFPLHENIIRPYPGRNLDFVKNIFNYRISRARRTIESAFGILSQRWLILRRTINASVEVVEAIVQATVVLHNFLQNSELDLAPSERKYCPTGFADCISENGTIQPGIWREAGVTLQPINRIGSNNYSTSVKNQRDTLANFFVSQEGRVPWQEDYILRGSLPARM